MTLRRLEPRKDVDEEDQADSRDRLLKVADMLVGIGVLSVREPSESMMEHGVIKRYVSRGQAEESSKWIIDLKENHEDHVFTAAHVPALASTGSTTSPTMIGDTAEDLMELLSGQVISVLSKRKEAAEAAADRKLQAIKAMRLLDDAEEEQAVDEDVNGGEILGELDQISSMTLVGINTACEKEANRRLLVFKRVGAGEWSGSEFMVVDPFCESLYSKWGKTNMSVYDGGLCCDEDMVSILTGYRSDGSEPPTSHVHDFHLDRIRDVVRR